MVFGFYIFFLFMNQCKNCSLINMNVKKIKNDMCNYF